MKSTRETNERSPSEAIPIAGLSPPPLLMKTIQVRRLICSPLFQRPMDKKEKLNPIPLLASNES